MRTLLISALFVVALPGPAAPAASQCGYPHAETYVVDATPRSKSYRIGERAVFDVTVHRAETGMPVEGAEVVMMLDWGDKKAAIVGFARETTDAEGEVAVKTRLKHRRLKPGWVTTMTYARTVHLRTMACGDVIEYGYEVEERAFRVSR